MSPRSLRSGRYALLGIAIFNGLLIADSALAAKKPDTSRYPPELPGGKQVVTDKSPKFLKPVGELKSGVTIAKTAPQIDFLYFPGQTYPGKPWSNWGDGMAIEGKYYTAVGDHLGPAGNALVFEYDAAKKQLRKLADVKKLLHRPEGHYSPGKIHSRIELGSDGWLYFATHRGSSKHTNDEYHYAGDWILRCHPETAKAEIVAHAPVPYHCIPASLLDPERMIFYGGTAAGVGKDISFFAYDLKARKLLHAEPRGPYRAMFLANSTGKLYYVQDTDTGSLMCYDPASGKPPRSVGVEIGLRAATSETADGMIYTVSSGQGKGEATLWSFDTKTEKVKRLGDAAVGGEAYITSLDVDPTGRYLYYTPGAHGSGPKDGTPIVQFDLRTGKKKVIAFLHPFYEEKYNCRLIGTFATSVDPAGDKLYATWNAGWDGSSWNVTALTTIHIPVEERQP